MKWFVLLPAAVLVLSGCATAPVDVEEEGPAVQPRSETGIAAASGDAAATDASAGTGKTGAQAEGPGYRLESVSSYLSNGVLDTVTKLVYVDGFLVKEQTVFGDGSPAGEVRYTYGGGRVILSEKLDRFGELLSSQTYTYDNRGNLITEELLDSGGNLIYAYRYAYDPEGRRSRWEIVADDGLMLSFAEYLYSNGRNTRVEMFDAAGEMQEVLERTFDDGGNPVLEVISDIDNNELEKVRFTYDDGMLAEKETHIRTRKIGSTKYRYDESGRLVTMIRYDRKGEVSQTDEYGYVEVKQ